LQSQTPQGFWSVTHYCIIIATVARAVASGTVIERYCKLQLLSNRHCLYMVIAIIELFNEEQLLSDRHCPATAIAFIWLLQLLSYLSKSNY